MDISPSIGMLMQMAYDTLVPASRARGASAWTGNIVTAGATLKSRVGLIEFPPHDVTAFLALCRSNNSSFTGALHTLAVRVLSRLIFLCHDNTQKTIPCFVLISLRGAAGISQEIMCNCTSRAHFYPSVQPGLMLPTAPPSFVRIVRRGRKSGCSNM